MRLHSVAAMCAAGAAVAMAAQAVPKPVKIEKAAFDGFPANLTVPMPNGNYSLHDMIREHNRSTITFPSGVKKQPANKNQQIANKPNPADVCINSYGGYVVVVSSGTPINRGDEACSQYGFQWAVVDSDTVFNLFRTMIGCSTVVASIRSYNGYNSTTCSITALGALFAVDLPPEECEEPTLAFICQEIPEESVTVTEYTRVTTEYLTTTVTDVVKPTCPSCKLHTCPFTKNNLHVIQERMPYREAKCACKELGMHLADLDILNFLDATDVEFQCAGAFKKAWINSWNGDRYNHSCLALSTGVMAPGGSINVPECCSVKLPVICQANPCYSQCKPCWGRWDKPCRSCPRECQDNWWPVPCSDSNDQNCWPYVDQERCPCDNWGNQEWDSYCQDDKEHCRNPYRDDSYGGEHKPNYYGYDNNVQYHNHRHGHHNNTYGYKPYGGYCPCSGSSDSRSHSHSHSHSHSQGPTKLSKPEGASANTNAKEEGAKPEAKKLAESPQPQQKVDFGKKTAKDYEVYERHHKDIHLLRKRYSWEEAKHACKCHGWRLLDVTYENVVDVKHLLQHHDVWGPAWIRSWFFFDAGECRAAINTEEEDEAPTKSDASKLIKGAKLIPKPQYKSKNEEMHSWLVGLFLEFEPLCRAELHVLCQEYPRVPATSTGPIEVSTSYSYTTTTEPVTVTRDIETVTVTVTLVK